MLTVTPAAEGGVFWLIERRIEDGRWIPVDQEMMRLCSRASVASRMIEVNALREYRPRELLNGVWAALVPDTAQIVRDLLERAEVPSERLRTVETSVTRRFS